VSRTVLVGLHQFADLQKLHQFSVAPGWKLLRLLEENLSRTTILAAFTSLQFRLTQAVKHIEKQFNSIHRVYGIEGLDSVSTVDSTRSSVCSAFTKGEAVVELGQLLARPDYGFRFPNVFAKHALITASLTLNNSHEACTIFYKEWIDEELILAASTVVIRNDKSLLTETIASELPRPPTPPRRLAFNNTS
jgi:hypothetical protein